MLRSALVRLKDAQIASLSIERRFDLAYNSAHALALAAFGFGVLRRSTAYIPVGVRWYGYRSDNRYLVFQCVPHTLGLDNKAMQILNKCHVARNRIEYHGEFDIGESMLAALIDVVKVLQQKVLALGPVTN